jgi:predicted dehydrogenase
VVERIELMATGSDDKHNAKRPEPVRYAVVGLGYIAQAAVLPAFAHARENSILTALISGSPDKLQKLGRQYNVKDCFAYEEYFLALRSGAFDAIYIALPNSMHAEFATSALEAGIHVLCEKPMASTVRECENMIVAAHSSNRKLMIAYRLHFEKSNLEAVRVAQSRQLGNLRQFTSTFTMNVKPGDIRLKADLGGGPVADIGIYCINAARYLFRDEPDQVYASAMSCDDHRFKEVPEMVSVIMQFPKDRIATFQCGFNAGKVSEYRLVGTRGDLRVEPAFELADDLNHHLTIDEKVTESVFRKRDQFAPELVHFSNCIQTGEAPSPSGEEGLADVRIIEAISASIESGNTVSINGVAPPHRPDPDQEMRKRPVRMPKLISASSPSGK